MLVDERPEDDDEEAIDKCVGMELVLDVGTNDQRGARVVKRSRDNDGRPIGRAHTNPIMDSCEYEIELADGTYAKTRCTHQEMNSITERAWATMDTMARIMSPAEDSRPTQRLV